MYRNLEAELIRKDISRDDLAEAIGKSYNTLSNKMIGKAPFLYDEVLTIKRKFFPDCDLEYLFQKS